MENAYSSILEKIFKINNNAMEIEVLKNILDNIHEFIIIIDKNGTVVYINQAYSEILGVPRHKIIGKTLKKIEAQAMSLGVLETGQPIKDGPTHLNSLNIDVVANIYPINHEGTILGSIGIFRNISEITKLNNEIEHFKLLAKTLEDELKQQKILPEPFKDIVGNNKRMIKVFSIAALAANTDSTILIQGESGVGKEVLAKAIHESSRRANSDFIKINCAAIPDSLFESELFGYEEGAFTGAKKGGKKGKIEIANKGTLLLDEISEMSLPMQSKLLRVLQERELERVGGQKPVKVDVRILAATNRNLKELVQKKQFREDLFYRINVMPLTIPPLRERKDDISALTRNYLKKLSQEHNRSFICSNEVLNIFYSYSWPGNIRELQNALEYAAIICQEKLILPEHLPVHLNSHIPVKFFQDQTNIKLKELIEEVEEKAIKSAIKMANNNKTKAMEILGLSRRAFYQKLSKYKLNANDSE